MSGGGIHGITFETELSGYQSEMENPEPITVSLADTTIPVEGRDKIEVIVEYDDVELKQPGLFGGGSRFYIIDYEGQQQNPSNAGGQTSFKIENNKAGVSLSPWVHIYDNFKGGQAKLVMELVPAMGEKLIKEWTLDISPYVLNSDR